MQPDYDSLVGNMLGMDQARGVKTALSEAYGTNPNIEAELQRVSKTTGVPLSTARNMPNETKRTAYVNGINAFELAQNYPIFARFITNENNARVAHDDVENLTALEKAVRELPDEFGSMTGPSPSVDSYLSGLGQSFTSAAESARQGIRQQFADAFGFEGMSEDAQRRYAAAQMQNRMVTPEFESSTAQGIYGGASSVMQMIPAVTAGVVTRSPAITLSALGLQTQAQSYPRYRLRGAEPGMALLGATGEGAVEVATEMLPMGFLVSRLGKTGAGEFLAGFLGRELPTEQVATLVQDAIDTAIANPDKTWEEYVAERPEAAYQTALGSLVASGVFGGANAVVMRAARQQQNAQMAERDAQFLERVTQTAQASALAKRDPDTFEQFIEMASENGPVQSVYLDANTLMQSGIAQDLAQVSPSIAAQVEEAAALGGSVHIPIAEYAARIAPTEHAAALLDHLKTNPDGFSRAEAQAYMQTQAEQLEAEVEQRIAQMDGQNEFRESQQRVKDLVHNELNTLNRFTEGKNELDATLIAARTAVRAAQLGMTPEALFERQRLRFAAENIAGDAVLDQGDVGRSDQLDEATGLPLNDDGTVTVYHHTSAENAAEIRRTGKLRADAEPDLYFTTTAETNTGYGDTAIPFRVAPSRLLLDDEFPGGRQDYRVETNRADRTRRVRFLPDGGAVLNQGGGLDALRQQWRDEGIDAAVSEKDGVITLSKIIVPEDARDAGQGTAAMQALVNYADRTGQHIALSPSADFGGNKKRLTEFYKRFGFVQNKGKNRAFSTSETMYRQARDKVLYQGARGAFSPDTNTIALLKNADLSTFLHEAGHYFFESDISLAGELVQEGRYFGNNALSEGEQQIVDDVSTLLRWHGITGPIEEQLATWANLDFEEKRAYHERTAESFERYLFEGQAPSIELQPYFQTFRAWLLNVYRNIKDFLTRNPEAGQLNDEVRSVFDRMLATNEQIELAQQARSMMPLFRTEADAENIGMTPDEFAAYQRQDPQATNDAAQDLQARGLRDLQWTRNARNKEIKRLQRQSAQLRREARIEVRREVMNQPVYRAWQFLTGKLSDEDQITPAERPRSDPNVLDPTVDSLFAAIAKLGGIRKEDVVREWGIEQSERPESGVFGKPVLRVTDGLALDEMRQALIENGYLSAQDTNPRELEERFDAELRGDRQYSNQVNEAVLMGDPVAGEGIDIAQLGAGRLELASLREMGFTEDEINVLKTRRMTAKVGLHPDMVADLPGIQMGAGETLVRTLLDADSPSVVIEGLTDARMLQEHGELATPEAIEREADKAIHNEARARMVATEANALAKATGQRRILAAAAKQFAQAMVARVKVRNLKPSQYANAAARAGKAAEKASRGGDINQAAVEKRTQLVNTYATQAAYDARTEVDSTIRYLRKFDSDGTRKGLDVEYLDQIDSLLARFDLRSGQTLRAIDKRTSLANWLAAQEQEGFEPDIPEYLANEANRTHFKNLTIEQLRGLSDTVRQIEHLGRLKKQLLTAKDKRELDAIVSQIAERIETSADGRVVDNERRNTLQSQANYVWRGAMAAHRKAASVVREMDGFEDGGPMWEYLTRSMNEAGDREAAMRAQAATQLHELAKPITSGEPMGGRGRYFGALNRHLNRGERIAIALNWGNESNRQRITRGHGWTAAQLQPVLQSLTTQEWQFVQGVWDFFESYRPQIAAKERRVYGKEPDWIDPSPFTLQTADGQTVTIDGGYYPIKYDPAQSGKAGEFAEAEEAKAMMRAAYTASTTRRSFTKSRAESVTGRPLMLTFDGIWQGANEVIHDLAWHEWLIDANRLLKRLDAPIRTHYGAEYVDVLRKVVKDTARGDIPAANMIEKALHHARVGVTVVGMGWNLTTAMLQPLGLTNSIVRVGAKWIARGASQFYGSPWQMAEKAREVRAMSSMMDNRAMTMNREINDVRNRLEARSDWRQKMETTYFVLIQKLQASVDYPTWLGAYEKAMADPANLYPDGTLNESRAVALADQAVLDAQGGGQIKDLAQVQRGGPLPKLFTNFYSYFNVLMNMTTEQTRKRVKKGQYLALAGDYMLLMIVPAILSAMLRDALKGEDDEDEYVKGIAGELVGYPFGMFVGLREMAGAAQAMVGVGGPFNYSGPAGVRLFGEIDKLGKQVGQGELDAALFKSANNVAGILFHYPAGQVNRLVDGAVALAEGRTNNPLAPLVGVPYDR